ncbi:MAG: DUF2231 domain-containing protein [Planctomycetes bacterium]|nr:DUF2231 domain-containing protein [Planctomycetota bacterium]
MDSLPNVHPAVVHFPIALLLVAAVLDLVAIFARRESLARCGGLLLVLAAAGGLVALLTGFAAEESASPLGNPAAAGEALERHEIAAIVTFVLTAVLAGWRLVGKLQLPRGAMKWVYVVLLLAATVGVGLTGHLGGTLVFDHGMGVAEPAATAFHD